MIMLCYITHVMLYNTRYVICYKTHDYVMLYNTRYVICYKTHDYVMLYNT